MSTTAYTTKAVTFLADHADVWEAAGDSLILLRFDPWSIDVQVMDDEAAASIATALGITSDPVRDPGPNDSDGYTRSAVIDGLRINIVSFWTLEATA